MAKTGSSINARCHLLPFMSINIGNCKKLITERIYTDLSNPIKMNAVCRIAVIIVEPNFS